jgi:2-polyprenyl-6-hydroxyphenyl methylase/3-demethylubiquinone-9 3-methyltransferase
MSLTIYPQLKRKIAPSAGGLLPDCKICGSPTRHFATVDFNKFCDGDPYRLGIADLAVNYFACGNCECKFTDFFDNWSEEDFSNFLYNDEYIKVDPDYTFTRPFETARLLRHRLLPVQALRMLDYGSGSGIMAKIMNEFGFNFDAYDPFSSPKKPEGLFDVVTAFEVIEHSPRPLETFQQISDFLPDRKIVLVGQSLQPPDIDEIGGSWWYMAPRNGHCTTYSQKTFEILAANMGLKVKFGSGLYAFYSHDDEITELTLGAVL